MQFRHVGKRIQCIRSIYNKETKKCEQKQICSIPDTTTAIPESLGVLADLTDQELKDLAVFLNNRNLNARSGSLKQLCDNAPVLLADLNEIVQNSSDWINQEWVDVIWERITLLQKSLKKSGFPKFKKNNSTEKKKRQPESKSPVSSVQKSESSQSKSSSNVEKAEKKSKPATEKKQADNRIKQAVSQANVQEKSVQQKSIFAEYHAEIVSLQNAGKSANQILEFLKGNHKDKAELFTYNGVRSYIRRNVKR